MTDERFSRTAGLLGEAAVNRLAASRVLLFGLGGVGGYALEALARAGVGEFWLVDFDRVSVSNINRQILADDTTVGRMKTDVAAERVARINPAARTEVRPVFADAENIPTLLDEARPDYIIDAIDCVPAKIALAVEANARQIPLVASMGTGNKLDPSKLIIGDISKTHTCPLARAVRAKLRAAGILHLDVLWSSEKPVTPAPQPDGRTLPASVSFVPSVAGLMLGGFVVRRLVGLAF